MQEAQHLYTIQLRSRLTLLLLVTPLSAGFLRGIRYSRGYGLNYSISYVLARQPAGAGYIPGRGACNPNFTMNIIFIGPQ